MLALEKVHNIFWKLMGLSLSCTIWENRFLTQSMRSEKFPSGGKLFIFDT